MEIVVMAHKSRQEWANELADQLGGQVVMAGNMWDTAKACCRTIAQSGASHGLIIQDDSVIHPTLLDHLPHLRRDIVVQLFAGRLPSPQRVKRGHDQAQQAGSNWWLDRPVWGVANVLPSDRLEEFCQWGDRINHYSYDSRLSRFYQTAAILSPSLVDHRGDRSVDGQRRPIRVAHEFGEPRFDWTVEPVEYTRKRPRRGAPHTPLR